MRGWWWHRQGLDGRLAGASPAKVLQEIGWCRSVGGSTPYLTLFSRAGIGRKKADVAVAKAQIHELPSARGCMYFVPKQDFALALKIGQPFRAAEIRTADKLGVTAKEIDKLCRQVLDALAHEPMAPEGLRTAVGGAVRSLGEAGKKKGITTTMPVALGKLQAEGEIRRIPTDGRLDSQRYFYRLWNPNPLTKLKMDLAACHVALARRYFQWIGPASLAEFRWFSGLGVNAAKEAMASLDLVSVDSGERWIPAEAEADYRKFKESKKPVYALIGCLDGLVHLRRDLDALLDPGDSPRKIMAGKAAKSVGGLSDLPSNGIVDRGRVIGLWEYDPDGESVVWMTFGKADKALRACVERTETLVREELGDARNFSMDSPKRRAPRIQALRAASA